MKVMIGLETHVQLATNSKLFCACSATEGEPNRNTCEICLGFPGSKPALNQKVVEKAVELALLLHCKINPASRFVRKIYFYPDLAKCFQITQYEETLATHGQFSIETSGKEGETKKTIRIGRVQIEEDPGKVEYLGGEHIGTARQVLVDYNRSGIPLCEVVTEPDFESIEEAVTYVKKLGHLLAYLDILDPGREGSMRTDANISIDGGARVELKNISGSAAVEKALKAELSRQSFLVAQGKKVGRETRTYSEETGTTILLRKKEFEEDYGYIREPDLLPVVLSPEFIETVRVRMKKLPEQVEAEILQLYHLPVQMVRALAYKRGLYDYFKSGIGHSKAVPVELLARWLIGDFLKCANWHTYEIEQCPPIAKFMEFMQEIAQGSISEREGKELIKKMFDAPKASVSSLRSAENVQNLDAVIEKVVNANPAALEGVRKGEEKSVHFLVGQVLRASGFKGDPKEIAKRIRERK